jgi:hypothetical protein
MNLTRVSWTVIKSLLTNLTKRIISMLRQPSLILWNFKSLGRFQLSMLTIQ